MGYDEALAERARRVLDGAEGLEEKAMFGGLCFLANGHMIGGIVRDRLCIRVGAAAYEAALRERHAEPMTFTGRPLQGMVYVNPPGFEKNADLAKWLGRGLAYVGTLPPKKAGAARARAAERAKKPARPPRAKKAPAKRRAR